MLTKTEAPKKEDLALMKDGGAPDGYKGAVPVPAESVEAAAEKPKEEGKQVESAKVEEKKPEETKLEDGKPVEKASDSTFLKIETELAKPEGKEDTSKFTPEMKAYFYQMRRDRKLRQKAEEERDAAVFQATQLKLKTKPEEKEEDPIEVLKKKDPSDFMTTGEVLDLLEKQKAKGEKPKPVGPDKVQLRYLQSCDREAAAAHKEDYEAVMELVPDLVNRNPKYLEQIAQSMIDGENPAETTYSLIKSDPEFANLFPAAQTRFAAKKASISAPQTEVAPEVKASPTEAAKRAQEALEAGAGKTKTTGHAGSNEGKATEEMTLDEFMGLSDRQFRELPKKTRESLLRKYGS